MWSILTQEYLIKIRLALLVPFFFDGGRTKWLADLLRESIASWEELTEAFYIRFFPPPKMVKLRDEMTEINRAWYTQEDQVSPLNFRITKEQIDREKERDENTSKMMPLMELLRKQVLESVDEIKEVKRVSRFEEGSCPSYLSRVGIKVGTHLLKLNGEDTIKIGLTKMTFGKEKTIMRSIICKQVTTQNLRIVQKVFEWMNCYRAF